MVNTNVITMQNIIIFKLFSNSCEKITFLLFYCVYHTIVALSCFSWVIEVPSISLKENSVKPNIRADRSGFFISKNLK